MRQGPASGSGGQHRGQQGSGAWPPRGVDEGPGTAMHVVLQVIESAGWAGERANQIQVREPPPKEKFNFGKKHKIRLAIYIFEVKCIGRRRKKAAKNVRVPGVRHMRHDAATLASTGARAHRSPRHSISVSATPSPLTMPPPRPRPLLVSRPPPHPRRAALHPR